MDENTTLNAEPRLPDVRRVLYIGCVLHRLSQQALISHAQRWFMETSGRNLPENWIKRAHHMTVKFKPSQTDLDALSPLLGQIVPLEVVGLAADEFATAALVQPGKNLPLMQGSPHITIAHSREVMPVYSNTLVSNPSKISQVAPLTLESELVCVLQHNTLFPPLVNPATGG